MEGMSSLYSQNLNFSPARNVNVPSPHVRASPAPPGIESQYITELLAERQKLAPFMQVLPVCSRLLDQEILRVTGKLSNQGFGEYDRLQRGNPSPMPSFNMIPSIGGKGTSGWNGIGWTTILYEPRIAAPQGTPMEWQSSPGSSRSIMVKIVSRLDIPVDAFPTFNFVGRLLGPRGNSLKRVEALTGCRVFIRGKGSIKDPDKEESLKGRPGYEHLSEPLHVLVEADLPVSIVDVKVKQAQDIITELLQPVEESHDFYKKEQLRELALLNNFREESPGPRASMSPLTSSGMKRPKTAW